MEANNFIFFGNVAKKLAAVEDEAERNDFAWRVIQYGAFHEKHMTGNAFKDGWLEELFFAIDSNQSKYTQRVENGKKNGRKRFFDRDELKTLIAEGKTGPQIADILGVSKDAIYHDEVWINRRINNNYKDLL